jgi:putative endonuclease
VVDFIGLVVQDVKRKNMFYYIYVLKSIKDGKLYIRKTKDLRKRVDYHNKGFVKATKNRRPLILIYYEAYTNKEKWDKQELFYKSGVGKDALKYKLQ